MNSEVTNTAHSTSRSSLNKAGASDQRPVPKPIVSRLAMQTMYHTQTKRIEVQGLRYVIVFHSIVVCGQQLERTKGTFN